MHQKTQEMGDKVNELLLRVLIVPLMESDPIEVRHKEKVQ
jgi:hypothetical protein